MSRLRRMGEAVVIAGVMCYRYTLRPLLPASCVFTPSCSEYMVQAVRKHGPLKGTKKGLLRLCRCNPFSKGGFDPP